MRYNTTTSCNEIIDRIQLNPVSFYFCTDPLERERRGGEYFLDCLGTC